MIGATDTSRNTTIFALIHLFKSNNKFTSLILKEIDTNLNNQNKIDCTSKGDINNIEHKLLTAQHFPQLHCVINEALRLNPPLPTTDEYVITKNI